MSERLSVELARKVQTTQGVRPKAATIPVPGYYWLKQTRCNFYWIDKDGTRLDNPTHNEIWSVYTWELQEVSEWFIARVEDDGSFDVVSSDETSNWENEHSIITHVSRRVYPPT